MAVGSLESYYVSGSLYKRYSYHYTSGAIFKRHSYHYTSGDLYDRFSLTEAQKINRRAVEAFDSQVAGAGPIIFSQTASASEQTSILAVQQLQARVIAEARSSQSSLLNLKV